MISKRRYHHCATGFQLSHTWRNGSEAAGYTVTEVIREERTRGISGTTNVAGTSGQCSIVSKQSGTDGNINIGKSTDAKA